MTRIPRWIVWAAPLCALCGCMTGEPASGGKSKAAEFSYQVTPETMRLIEGKRAYDIYCVGCHGAKGDGAGEAARVMIPRPRDFTKAQFKFSSTRFGELPTDDDLMRTITNGLRGSAMPAWGHLPEETRRALVAYVKTFSEVWKRGPSPVIPLVNDPYMETEDKSAAIARGEMAYHGFFTCWNCHPAYVSEAKISEYIAAMGGQPKDTYRPNIAQTAPKKDSNNETIFAPDFLRDYVKSGTTVGDLYRTIGAGITGTAMPTWIDSVTPDMAPRGPDGNLLVSSADIWALAYYVQKLIQERKVRLPVGQVVVRADRKATIGPLHTTFDHVVQDAASPPGEAEEFIDE